MNRGAILVFAIVLGGCVHRPPAAPQAMGLDDVLDFADPARCEPGPSFAKLLAAMVEGDANVGFRAGDIAVPVRYAVAFSAVQLQETQGYTVIGTSVRGTLYGLPIVAIEQSLPQGGDPGEFHVRFDAASSLIERALAERGFPVKLGQSVTLGPPEGYEQFIELINDPAHPGHTLLSCGYR